MPTPQLYDRYARAKGWKRLLFPDGRILQSAELNEIQRVLGDEFAQFARTIFFDGSIVRGLDLVVQSTTATVTAGQIYWGGYFHDFVGGAVTITGAGDEVVGLLFSETQVTEGEDSTLLDPAQEWPGYGEPGAWRLTYTISVVVDNPAAVPLYTLRDGVQISSARPEPDYTELAKTLARRTNDESGSYLVEGMRSYVEALDGSTFNLVTAAGKGYIQGFEITFPAPVRTVVDRPLEYRTVLQEPKVFSSGTDLYPLSNPPAKQILTVSAIVEKIVNVTRGGTPGGQDIMPNTPLSSIVEIHQGATNYAVTADYLVSGDYVAWSPAGIEPATGSTYTVTLRYVKQMVVTDDYLLTDDSLDFSPAGDNPVDGTTVYVNYEHYLPRYDRVALDQYGAIIVAKGAASLFPSAPPAPAGTLSIATLYYPPNADPGEVVVSDTELYRLSMAEIADLRERIRDLEYNAAVSDLDQEALNVELPTTKKAVFTDVFRDLEKVDTGHGLWSAAVDPVGLILLPSFEVGFHDLTGQSGITQMLAYSDVALITQPYATDITNVNPYSVFSDQAMLTLTPPDDTWIESQTIYVDRQEWQKNTRFGYWMQVSGTSEVRVTGTSRAKTVAVAGDLFTSNADNLALAMDGVAYSMTPTGATEAGTSGGTVKSNAAGSFTATFDVPAGIPDGPKAVVVSNLNNRGETQYRISTIRRTTTVGWTWIRHTDPVAQTFTVPEPVFVSAVDLFLATKDADRGLHISLRNVINGFPGQDILAETVVSPGSISTSANGSAATHVTFARPAYCAPGREYAIVVATDSDEYGIFYARLGHRDLVTDQYVSANPHSGVMLTSANASTWSPDQSADLKFTIYRAEFTTPRVVDFDAAVIDGSLLHLFADQFIPVGTRVVWEYSGDAGASWSAIEPAVNVDTGQMLTGADVRATLYGTNKLSPVVAVPPGLLVVKWEASGTYISRNTILSAYTDIRLYMDINVPSGTSVAVYYSIDDGSSWVDMGAGTLQAVVGGGFSEYLWTATGLASPTQIRVRVDLTANAGRTLVAKARRLRVIAT